MAPEIRHVGAAARTPGLCASTIVSRLRCDHPGLPDRNRGGFGDFQLYNDHDEPMIDAHPSVVIKPCRHSDTALVRSARLSLR